MRKIIITAGGTSEKIDNVRKITNSSTGKLGKLIAEHLINTIRDLKLYYICSKDALRPNSKANIIEVESVDDLKNKVQFLLRNEDIDVFIHSMAVSDYTVDFTTTFNSIGKCDCLDYDDFSTNVEKNNDNKISSNEEHLVIFLKKTIKVISIVKNISPRTFLVGFKLLDGVSKDKLISVAGDLMKKNNCDIVVANDLSNIRNGCHIAYILDESGEIETAKGKDDIAKRLVKKIINN